MSVDARKEEFEHVELFGKPALFTNERISHFTVPQGWFCYDLRGKDNDPGDPATIEKYVGVSHAGTILTPTEVSFKKGRNHMKIGDGLNFLGESLTLEQFCSAHGLDYPKDERKFIPRPASPEETGLFFAMTPEEDAELGCIGHLRMDFGHRGKEFWHTWWPRGPEELNSRQFKDELRKVVDTLRETVLKDLRSMQHYCHEHGGKIPGGICTQNHGYVVETENYRYCLRCNPIPGDYQAYLTCFDKRAQEMNMARGKQDASVPTMTMEGM